MKLNADLKFLCKDFYFFILSLIYFRDGNIFYCMLNYFEEIWKLFIHLIFFKRCLSDLQICYLTFLYILFDCHDFFSVSVTFFLIIDLSGFNKKNDASTFRFLGHKKYFHCNVCTIENIVWKNFIHVIIF